MTGLLNGIEARARQAARSAAFATIGVIFAMIGLGFLTAGLWILIAAYEGALIAFVAIGALYLILGLCFLALGRQPGGTPPLRIVRLPRNRLRKKIFSCRSPKVSPPACRPAAPRAIRAHEKAGAAASPARRRAQCGSASRRGVSASRIICSVKGRTSIPQPCWSTTLSSSSPIVRMIRAPLSARL